jgi:DNA-binding MarR family transcriptional regulator
VSRQDKFSVPASSDASGDPSFEDFDLQINLRLRLDEVADLEAVELRRKPKPEPTRRQLCQVAARIYESRRLRDRVLDQKLFGEPAWDMLLALYFMPAQGQMITVTSLSHAAEVPATTGFRWQKTLEATALIERGPSIDGDGRRIMLRLSDIGRELMEKYLIRLYYAELPSAPAHPERAGR